MSRKKNDTFTAVSFALFGLVVGFILAVLFAPKSGKAVREKFWKMIDDAEKTLDEELEEREIN